MWRNAASWSAALIAAVLTIAPPADARTLDEIIKAGVVRIGVTANLPPQSSLNTQNQMEGMDIDFGHLIAAALGVKAEFIVQEEPARVPNLVADVTDISLGGLTRNHRRAILIDYTLPTFTESQVVLTTEKHKEKKTWEDFNRPEITLVSVRSTTPAEWTRENAKNAKELLVESGADMIRAIAQGRADGTIGIIDNFIRFTKIYPDVKWMVLPETIYLGYQAMGVKKGNDSLRVVLNNWLFNWQRTGAHIALWEKWFGAPPIFPIEPQPYF